MFWITEKQTNTKTNPPLNLCHPDWLSAGVCVGGVVTHGPYSRPLCCSCPQGWQSCCPCSWRCQILVCWCVCVGSNRDTWVAVTMTGSARKESTVSGITRPLRAALHTHTHTHTKLLVQHCEASYGTSTVVLGCESAHTRSKQHEFLIVKPVLKWLSNICCILIRIIKYIDMVYICARFFYAPKKTKTMQLKGTRTEEAEVLCRVNRCDLLWPEHTTLLSWVHLQEGSLVSGVQRPPHHLIPHIEILLNAVCFCPFCLMAARLRRPKVSSWVRGLLPFGTATITNALRALSFA